MNYELIMESGEYALILRGNKMKEYAVVNGLNKEIGEWCWTCCYYCFYCEGVQAPCTQAEALALCVDYLRMRTETDYIPRCRLEELATQFKDGLIEDDEESAMEYFDEVCEMTESEKKFFGIETESEEEDFDDSPAWEDDSDRGCEDCPPEECTGHCMSCYYRPV